MRDFHYVYVLRGLQDGFSYIGSTNNLKRRFAMHNRGLIDSTRPCRPFELAFYEAYRNVHDAKRREAYLKTSKGKTTLRSMLEDFLAMHQTVQGSPPDKNS